MSAIQTSIIIPVYNKWELTRNCLISLAETLPAGVLFEVFVVDNASSDQTPEACPALGRELFGDAFHYHRSEQNLNFGPANNLAAKMAKGEFLLLLNNDTVAKPGWYLPLLEDFARIDNLGVTGPLLVYPPSEPFGETIQHLGVSVDPFLNVGHLYEGIPAQSPLARKRRFFQIITGACMLIPRTLFLELGGFDEGYVNGFEDVDLCVKIRSAGYFLTVNPESTVIHFASQSPGRMDKEQQNARHFARTTQHLLAPDLHMHLEGDEMHLELTPWQLVRPSISEHVKSRLAPLLSLNDAQALKDVLVRHPFWSKGCRKLADMKTGQGELEDALGYWRLLSRTNASPEHMLGMLDCARYAKNAEMVNDAFQKLLRYCRTTDYYRQKAEKRLLVSRFWSLETLAEAYEDWVEHIDSFKTELHAPFMRKMFELTRGTHASPLWDWAYALWQEIVDSPRRAAVVETHWDGNERPPHFSILMPVYNPDIGHLREAVDSVLKQDWQNWELCMVDDASTSPRVRPVMEAYAASDPRIRIKFRSTNGNISAATNTALEMARYEFSVLMDQDDLLTPDALSEVASAYRKHPGGKLFYSDEDKINDRGGLCHPYMKGEWDPELIKGQNFINHLGTYLTERMRSCGAFREGFEGAQDHDLVLRYTNGLTAEEIVHIPRVLYHWRMHDSSTSTGIEVKPEALGAGLQAVKEHLNRNGVHGRSEPVEGCGYYRFVYELSKPSPLVSLIIDLGKSIELWPEISKALFVKSGYAKFEVLVLCDDELAPASRKRLEREIESQKQIRLIEQKGAVNGAVRLNLAIEAAQGAVLGVLGRGIVPESQDWLGRVVSHLRSGGIGALGGKIISGNECIHHLGHAVTADKKLFSIFRGMPADTQPWYGWTCISRAVTSLDPRCMFMHKKDLLEAKGLDPEFGDAALIDFCLKCRQKGLISVSDPDAVFRLAYPVEAAWEDGIVIRNEALMEKWRDKLVPYHPDLTIGVEGWSFYYGKGLV